MSAHGKPGSPEQRKIWRDQSAARRLDPRLHKLLRKYDRNYHDRKKHRHLLYPERVSVISFSEYAKTNEPKARRVINTVKARPERSVKHKVDGITETEHEALAYLKRTHSPDEWKIRKAGGTPDWLVQHRTMKWKTIFYECKAEHDRFTKDTQFDLCQELVDAGFDVRVIIIRGTSP